MWKSFPLVSLWLFNVRDCFLTSGFLFPQLVILHQAVSVITSLESQVRGKAGLKFWYDVRTNGFLVVVVLYSKEYKEEFHIFLHEGTTLARALWNQTWLFSGHTLYN